MAKFDGQFETSKRDWETPDDLFDPLNDEFHFTLDVCASAENAKCDKYFTIDDNALAKDWTGVCWMNPPFGQKRQWTIKAYKESLKGATVVCLLPARTNTIWWHDYCIAHGEIRFIRGRVKFNGAEYGLPQPLAIVIFRPKTE